MDLGRQARRPGCRRGRDAAGGDRPLRGRLPRAAAAGPAPRRADPAPVLVAPARADDEQRRPAPRPPSRRRTMADDTVGKDVSPRSPATGLGGRRAARPAIRQRRAREGLPLGAVRAGGRFRGVVLHDVPQGRHRGVPREAAPHGAALPRPPPAQPLPGRPREVHRLRAVRVGLPGRRDPRRGRRQRRHPARPGWQGSVQPRRALRPRLPDQLPALHLLRPVHRGVPDARPDDDELLRARRQRPRQADLHQGPAARAAPERHAADAVPDVRRARGARLLPGQGQRTDRRAARLRRRPRRRRRRRRRVSPAAPGNVGAVRARGPRPRALHPPDRAQTREGANP